MANSFNSTLTKNVGISPVSLYTVPSSTTATAIGLNVANVTNISTLIDIFIVRGSQNFYLIKSAEVPVGGALVVIGGDQKHVLIAGDDIRAQTTQIDSVDITLSLLISS